MRLTILTLAIVACIVAVSPSCAQESEAAPKKKKPTVYLGVDAGLTTPTVWGTQIDLQTSPTAGGSLVTSNGFQLGFNAKIETSRAFYIRSGLFISNRKAEVVNSTFVYDMSINSQYVMIPAIMGLQFAPPVGQRGWKFGIELGPAITLVSYSDNLEKGLYPGQDINRAPQMVTLNAGANLEIPISDNMNVFVNYRFTKDLANYFSRRYYYTNSNSQQTYNDYDVWMTASGITGGILFRLERKGK